MSKTALWIISALLFCGAIYLLYIYLPGRQSELAKQGKFDKYGQVQMKDSRPDGDGKVSLFVTVLYKDEEGKNHRSTRQMYDAGLWDSLKTNQDIKVYYLPADPDNGSVEGAEGMTTPRAGAFRFLAWTTVLAGFITAFLAWRAPKPSGDRGPVMTRR